MFFTLWKKVVFRQPRMRCAGRRSARISIERRRRLSLEYLENRTLPSTFTVIDLGDAGVGSGLQGDLRYAINTANSNADLSNRIVFQPGLAGTISLVQGTLVISKALELSGSGADVLTVSGNHQSGVFDIEAPAGQTVILADLTIADGTGAGEYFGFAAGGGLFNDAATLVLNRTTFSRNTLPREPISAAGGALFNNRGSVTLNSGTITDNHGNGVTGLAIYNLGTMTIHNSTVSGNSGTLTGGNINNGGTMTLEDSVISGNSDNISNGGTITLTRCMVAQNTSAFGGGLSNSGSAVVTDSTIANNAASPTGGGIFNEFGQLTVRSSTISGNRATYAGGIFSLERTLTVMDSTISGNTAERQGGGILHGGIPGYQGFAEITGSTITGNITTENYSSDFGGGGIYNNERMVIRDTIVAGNQSAGEGPDVYGSVISVGYNLIGATDESSGWTATDLTGTSAAPLDPGLGPLQDNGGPTRTHALLLGSPAIGAGDTSLVGSRDQRGSVRGYTAHVDIGAFSTETVFGFRVLAPANVSSGQPFDVTVIAVDQWGNTVSTYVGTVHFSSTDLFAQLPDNTAFSGDDGGSHTFSVTLQSLGTQSIGVADANVTSITGSATVDVFGNSDAIGSPAGPGGFSYFWTISKAVYGKSHR
jgi:hypothetical protein